MFKNGDKVRVLYDIRDIDADDYLTPIAVAGDIATVVDDRDPKYIEVRIADAEEFSVLPSEIEHIQD